MISARILGYGKDYEVEIDDPTSPAQNKKETIDLTQFQMPMIMMVQATNLIKMNLSSHYHNQIESYFSNAITESKERKIKHHRSPKESI